MSQNYVYIKVQDTHNGQDSIHYIGEFHSVWEKGITLGSDPQCDVVLHDPKVQSHSVQAILVARSNHRFLRFFPDGKSLPIPDTMRTYTQDASRVDRHPFQLGSLLLCVIECEYPEEEKENITSYFVEEDLRKEISFQPNKTKKSFWRRFFS